MVLPKNHLVSGRTLTHRDMISEWSMSHYDPTSPGVVGSRPGRPAVDDLPDQRRLFGDSSESSARIPRQKSPAVAGPLALGDGLSIRRIERDQEGNQFLPARNTDGWRPGHTQGGNYEATTDALVLLRCCFAGSNGLCGHPQPQSSAGRPVVSARAWGRRTRPRCSHAGDAPCPAHGGDSDGTTNDSDAL